MNDEDDSGAAPSPSADMLFVYGKTDDDAYSVLRRRGEAVELGAIRGLEEGRPIHGEVVRLLARAEHPLLFDVDVVAETQPARSGPAQVATDEYRAGWELAFGNVGGNKDAPN
jgi:hypothetical protein